MRWNRILLSLVAAAFVGLAAVPANAQSLYGTALDRFDANKDGKISRSEVPEAYRGMFDRIAGQFKLDPEKTYDRKELEEKLGVTTSNGSPSGSSSSSSRGPSSSSRGPSGGSNAPSRGTFGSREPRRGSRPSGPNGSGGSSASRGNGKQFRALDELPSEYSNLDKDGDGQIGLYEWPKNDIARFLSLDLNDDGFLTLNELKKPSSRSESRESSGDKDASKDQKPAEAESKEAPPEQAAEQAAK